MSETINFDGLNFGMGWINDPAEVARIVALDSVKTASEVIGSRDKGERPVITDLTKYLEKLHGKEWYLNQGGCGSCVAFGAAIVCDTLIAIDVIENGAEYPGRVDPMTIYWGSRVEIGGGRIWGQGSVGIWAAKYLKEFGPLLQKKYNSIDLSTYSPSVCCGANARRGVPDELESEAREHPVRDYAQIKSFDDAANMVENGDPITVASNQGFTQFRDAQGFAKPSGRWPHQMGVLGVRHDRPGVLICNSWGAFYKGGPADMSPALQWTDAEDFDRMAKAGDTWALSNLKGWPRKRLNFLKLNW